MLKNLVEVKKELIQQPVVTQQFFDSFDLPENLLIELNSKLNSEGYYFQKNASYLQIKTSDIEKGNNYAFIPNQYLVIASKLYNFVQELSNYFIIFEKLKNYSNQLVGSAKIIEGNIKSDVKLSNIFQNGEDIVSFSKFLDKDDPTFRLDAKRLINDEGKHRQASDCFGSIVLKIINVPDATSGVLGKLIYNLSLNPSLYYEIYNFHNIKSVRNNTSDNSLSVSSFIILAGISGTGKSRWVREQAKLSSPYENRFNYCLVPVRPDWHEPSDLLGYESRINKTYVATDFLRFLIKAHFYYQNPILAEGQDPYIPPFWCCLDEMNRAPVEQYFADYLAILETRKWKNGEYTCDPLMSPELLCSDICGNLKTDLQPQNIDEDMYDNLWESFKKEGINLPPNLIVAGTVNMDETTHQFSRKVLDRAMTIDFNEFYPNDFNEYFEEIHKPKTLGYPILTSVKKTDLSSVKADPDGSKSLEFLTELNKQLKETPFELAYRAVSQLLLVVVQFDPIDEIHLHSVWDDFIMMKLLPRIEGDVDKLSKGEDKSVLGEIENILKDQISDIWEGVNRIDLLRENSGSKVHVKCRSRKKIRWMIDRLDNGYTSFWP